jgi:hypothetical protein
MAPFAKKATTDEQRLRGMPTNSSPVNVGRSAPTRNRNVDRRCVRVFGFNFSKGQNRPLFPNRRVMTPRRSRNGAPATRSPRGRNEARASFGVPSWTLFRSACAFRGVPICHVSLATRFRTQNRARTVVLTRHTRARLDVAHAPLSLVLRDQARARQVRRRDSSFRPPPRLLQPPRPLSRVARETDRNIPYPSPNAARATRGRRPRPPRPLGTRSALRTARMSLSRSL